MGKLMGVIQYSGKLGTTVGYKGSGGRQNVRVHVDTIKNPKTNGQLVQRMICATVGVGVSFMTEILNNAFEGKSFGAESLAYARKLWMNMLRTEDAASLSSTYKYLPKGQKEFICNPYQLSEGRLASPIVRINDPLDGEILVQGPATLSTSLTASQLFPDVAVGNQITVLVLLSNEDAVRPVYCRFAFKDDVTAALTQTDAGFYINPAAIDTTKAEGPWSSLQFNTGSNGEFIIGFAEIPNWESLFAAAILVSDKERNLRSRTFLVVAGDYDGNGEFAGGQVYPTYGESSVEVDFPSEWYLQNSVRPSNAGE